MLLSLDASDLELIELANLSMSIVDWLLIFRKLSFPFKALIVSMVFRCDIMFDYGI